MAGELPGGAPGPVGEELDDAVRELAGVASGSPAAQKRPGACRSSTISGLLGVAHEAEPES
eukprot:324858-Alexandrium_andersonii.AAC.1